MRRLMVLGAGGHAKAVAAAAQAAGFEIAGFFDDDPARFGEVLLGAPILGPITEADGHDGELIVAVGDNRTRLALAARFGDEARWATIVHPQAWVHASVVLGSGAVVMAGAVIQPDARIGAHAVVNTGASVDHDAWLGAGVHVAPGARVAGGVRIGDGALLGVGAVTIPGVVIGAGAVVGAGAAVVRDVPPNVTVAGVPARLLG